MVGKRKAVRRWNEAWVCALASSVGLLLLLASGVGIRMKLKVL